MDKINELWEFMIDRDIATYDELRLIIDINGFNLKSLEDVLYSRTGYRDLEQILEDGEW